MAAAKLDITLEEYSDFTKEFTYRDADGDPIDVTNYGASIVFKADNHNSPFYIGHATDSDSPILVGGTDGLVETQVPHKYWTNLDSMEGKWQLYIYPTANDITDRPKRLVEGRFVYSKSLLRNV